MGWLTVEIQALAFTALSIGVLHTLIGPDHYLPFIAMAKSRKWTLRHTLLVTLTCGFGHTLGSILLGMLGIALGYGLTIIETIESIRGDMAAYMLIAFGLAYLVYGLRCVARNKEHSHLHIHEDGTVHEHMHNHHAGHIHLHENCKNKSISTWMIFIIFVLGPCEALVPILMYPASQQNHMGLMFVTTLFVMATLLTMLIVVCVCYYSIEKIKPNYGIQQYTHALSGAVILICGVLITTGF